MTQTKIEKRKTIEEYEKLAEKLAADRDAAHEVAARVMRENAIIKGDLSRSLEQLMALLSGSAATSDEIPGSTAIVGAINMVLLGVSGKEVWEALGDKRPQVVAGVMQLSDNCRRALDQVARLQATSPKSQRKFRNVRPAKSKKT